MDLVTPELPDQKIDESAPDSIVIEDEKLQSLLDAEQEHFLLDLLPELAPPGFFSNRTLTGLKCLCRIQSVERLLRYRRQEEWIGSGAGP